MNYSFDLWDASPSERSIGSPNLFFEPESLQEGVHGVEKPLTEGTELLLLGRTPKIITGQQPTEPEHREEMAQELQCAYFSRMNGENGTQEQEKGRRRKKIKPSPYHNYQKHLNTALRHFVVFPPPTTASTPAELVAYQLWTVFLQNESSTKKILHFIFNQFNEYRIKVEELRAFGFEEIYSECSRGLLGEAKTFLTGVVLRQMNEEVIDGYLQTRRIKNQTKFKRYLMTFRKELQDGFLKKRFTNRNRKEQMRREIAQHLS